MTDAGMYGVTLALLGGWYGLLICKMGKEHRDERRELYSRLMAANLSDFTASENQVKPKGRNGIKKRLDEFNSRCFNSKT